LELSIAARQMRQSGDRRAGALVAEIEIQP